MLLIGRFGTIELAASNLIMQVNIFGLLPMVGMGITSSITVGKYIGAGKPDMAERAVNSCLTRTMAYISIMALLYFFLPDIFIYPFSYATDPLIFLPIHDLSVTLLKFVGVFIVARIWVS